MDATTMQNFLLAMSTPRFPPLDKNNFANWKRDMTVHLKKLQLFKYVEKDVKGEAEKDKKDAAWAIIHENCTQHAKNVIYDVEDPFKAWQLLEQHYAPKSAANIRRMLNEFNNAKMLATESGEDFIMRVKAAARDLTLVGQKVDDLNIINAIISGLGPEYTMLKVSLSAQQELSESQVTQAILSEEMRLKFEKAEKDKLAAAKKTDDDQRQSYRYRDQQRMDYRQDRQSRNRQRSRSPIGRSKFVRCDHCGKPGHISATCFELHPNLRPSYASGANASQPTNFYPPPAQFPWMPPPQAVQQQFQQQAQRQPPPVPTSQRPTLPIQQAAWVSAAPSYQHFQQQYAQQMQTQFPQLMQQYTTQQQPQQQQSHQGYTAQIDYANHSSDESVDSNAQFHSASIAFEVPEHAILLATDTYDSSFAISPGQTLYDIYDYAMVMDFPGNAEIIHVDSSPCHKWVVDSGASNHFVCNRHLLQDFQLIQPMMIRTGKGPIFGYGKGCVCLQLIVNGKRVIRTVEDVIWAPDLQGGVNLFSLPQMTSKGYNFVFGPEKCTIFRNNAVLAEATFRSKGFYLDVCDDEMDLYADSSSLFDSPSSNYNAFLHESSDTQPIDRWHLRLGHVGEQAIKKLELIATGLSIGPAKHATISSNCKICLNSGQTRQISRNSSHKVSKKLEVVHCDITGPFTIPSLNGLRFACNFLDEKSRLGRSCLTRYKSQNFSAYRVVEARWENESNGCKILNLRMDNAGENLSDDLRAHAQSRGIEIQVTQPYSPEMNGMIERWNRTILEMTIALLDHSQLPLEFWSEAWECAVYLKNRQPHSALDNMTPFEAFYGTKPNLGHVRVFGCHAHAHVPDELRNKMNWDLKSSECVLIGYTDTENLYKLWDCENRTIIYKRDVVFDEEKFGHPTFPPRQSSASTILPNFHLLNPTPIVDTLAEAHKLPNAPPQDPDVLNFLPLTQLPGSQHVQSIPSLNESRVPTANEHGTGQVAVNPNFEMYQPPDINARPIAKLRKPRLSKKTLEDEQNSLFAFLQPIDDSEQAFFASCMKFMSGIEFEDSVVHDWEPLGHSAFQVFDATQASLSKVSNKSTYPTALRDTKFSQPCIPQSYKAATLSPEATQWMDAMRVEMDALALNDTWDLVDPPKDPSFKAFPCKWVFAVKKDENDVVRKFKARLVARGDLQEEGKDYDETFAPVVKFVSVKLVIAIATQLDLELPHFDIVTAFLNGDIDKECYMRQPPGFSDGSSKVCKLKKALYGLCQAARRFYFKMDAVMLMLDYKRFQADWALWIHSSKTSCLAIHMDDITGAMNLLERKRVVEHLTKHFRVTDLGEAKCYLSLYIVRDRNAPKPSTKLHQTPYIKKILQNEGLDDSYPVSTPMVTNENWNRQSDVLDATGKQQYQRMIGCLLYVMHGTRPDIAFATIRLSQYASNPHSHYLQGVKRIFCYLKGTADAGIVYYKDSTATDLVFYFDAAHADSRLMRSTCGFIGFYKGCPITWSSKVQRTIALSTTEAEYMAGTEACKEVLWLKGLTDALGDLAPISWPITLYGDNQGSLALVRNPEYHQRTKHIALRERFITQLFEKSVIVVKHVNSGSQLADYLTKALPKDAHMLQSVSSNLDIAIPPTSFGIPTASATSATVKDPSAVENQPLSKGRKVKCYSCQNLFPNFESLMKHRVKCIKKKSSGNVSE